VQALYLALARGGRKDGGPLSARSLHNVHTVLRGSLEHAVRLELRPRNPAEKVTPPAGNPADDHEPAHWTADQVAAFLDRVDEMTVSGLSLTEKRTRRNGTTYKYRRELAPDPMQRALWYLAATTGMRRGEVCGLRWEDVDLDAGELAVKSSHVMVGGKVVESAPKTKRGRRVIALDPATIDVLRAWRRQQRRERLRYGLAWEDEGDHLLTHAVYFTKPPRHGVPVRPDWVTMAFRRLVDGSGLPDLNLHGLRHSWATAAYDAGEPLRAVSDHLGHADTSITDRIYIHAVRRVQDATALRVAALITSKRGAGR
jgi:integrase